MTDRSPLELDALGDGGGWDGRTATDLSWFVEARFGLFIHWGIYALGARHEQIQRRETVPAERYQRYFHHFNPDLFDPDRWAEVAANAGFRYFVITTKHHDGFCLWDTEYTDWKVTNTPYGRDLLGPLVEAMRARGIRVGFYYSQIDWHHPHFTVDDLHYLRDAPNRAELNRGRDMNKYREFLKGQMTELMTQFGQVDVLWFDGGDYKRSRKPPGEPWEGKDGKDWDVPALLKIIRQHQPSVLINDRLGDESLPGSIDFLCHEQALPAEGIRKRDRPVTWESPQTFSGSWGYFRDEKSWKSAEQVLHMLIYTVSRGGNLLLNIGPTARGEIEPRAMERLDRIGEWMRRHGRSIYGCGAPPQDIVVPDNSALTYNARTKRLYLHLLAWPATPGVKGATTRVYWRGLDVDRVAYAQLLNDASEVPMKRADGTKDLRGGWTPQDAVLDLPVQKPDVMTPVVELFLK